MYAVYRDRPRGVIAFGYLHVVPVFLVEIFDILPLEGLVLRVQLVVPSVLRRQLPIIVLRNLCTK